MVWLMGGLVGWLVDWWIGGFVGWLFVCLVGWLTFLVDLCKFIKTGKLDKPFDINVNSNLSFIDCGLSVHFNVFFI